MIVGGERADLDMWPGYVSRYELGEMIREYTADADEQRREADYLVSRQLRPAERDGFGVLYTSANGHRTDDVHERIERMSKANDAIRAAASSGRGLAAIERAQITQVMDDIDSGRIQAAPSCPSSCSSTSGPSPTPMPNARTRRPRPFPRPCVRT
ncbi:hypothetical protein [Nocardia sp. NPDC057668]|uniref:hypothetical protein n=1 Tax=Nocardia sp. NPDC057668 TaxID=3346202 RepID=UPI00366D9D80